MSTTEKPLPVLDPDHPLTVAVALALYAYNVKPGVRAEAIYEHFNGACMETWELLRAVQSPSVATELPAPSALVYVANALGLYRNEALHRVGANIGVDGVLLPSFRLLDALRAVLLFYTPDTWDDLKRDLWKELTGSDDATTKVLCDTVRRAMGNQL